MTRGLKPKNDPSVPLDPKPVDGAVEMVNPLDTPLAFTADAAEISAMRLLDAADKARKQS